MPRKPSPKPSSRSTSAKKTKAIATADRLVPSKPAQSKPAQSKPAQSKPAPRVKTQTHKASEKQLLIGNPVTKTTKTDGGHNTVPARKNAKRSRPEDSPVENGDVTDTQSHPAKKGKTMKTQTGSIHTDSAKPGKVKEAVNEIPSKILDVFVFGEGKNGELGLGNTIIDGKKPKFVKRPRLNPNLLASNVGVVQVACGGMHVVALTRDNKILTWGVNDQGALGRPTSWKYSEEDDDDDDDGYDLNAEESTPGLVDTSSLDPNLRWAQVVASDSASFALTDEGRVYGWGTFRSSEGIMGFDPDNFIQKTPILIPDLKDIRQLAAGNNHILALDGRGKIYTWGCGEQYQLARKVFHARARLALRPTTIGSLPIRGSKAVKVACGSYHSFAIDQEGRVFAWGLNNFGELGIREGAGEAGSAELKPRLVDGLSTKIVEIAGGEHHTVACSEDGKLFTWGRIDGYQVGLRGGLFTEENTLFDARSKPRILVVPTIVPELPTIVSVAAGTDHSIALTLDGKAYSWGFSEGGRTGLGTYDDIEVPTLIENTAVKDKKLIFAGCGGQFSVLASYHGEARE